MATVNDEVQDSGLDWITTNGTRVDITSSEATTYANATTSGANSLGNGTVTTGAAQAGDASGRKVTVGAVSGGSVTADGTAAWWALTDGSSTLIATGSLSSSQAVTNGNTFNLTAFDIEIPDPA